MTSTPLYRDFDAEALARQYMPSMTVPEAPREFERWKASSADFRARFDGVAALDVAYGDAPGERLDVYTRDDGPRPVHVYIHGGYWQRTDKADYSFLAAALVEAGLCVVVPNYTLCPATTVHGIVDEVRRACGWIHQNIAAHGGDPGRIHLSGHSAGGHLTAMMALTDWTSLDAALPADLVKTGIAISGVFDLEPLVHTPINEPLGLTIDSAREVSPLYLERVSPPPLAFAVGGDESAEFQRQSVAMRERWQAMGGAVSVIDCPGRHHFNVIDGLADTGSALYRGALAFARGR